MLSNSEKKKQLIIFVYFVLFCFVKQLMYFFTGYLQIAENKLKYLSVTVRLKKSDPEFECARTYSNNLYANLNKLLKSRASVVEHKYNMYKLHGSYGRIFSEWSVIENEMGDGLQKSGHYLDSLASSIDAALEDEELYADQIKEYLFYASTLEAVCKRQEVLQLQLENAEDMIVSKNLEKTRTQQGKTSLVSRLFGSIDTDEVRELKVSLIDQKIQEEQEMLKQAQQELTWVSLLQNHLMLLTLNVIGIF